MTRHGEGSKVGRAMFGRRTHVGAWMMGCGRPGSPRSAWVGTARTAPSPLGPPLRDHRPILDFPNSPHSPPPSYRASLGSSPPVRQTAPAYTLLHRAYAGTSFRGVMPDTRSLRADWRPVAPAPDQPQETRTRQDQALSSELSVFESPIQLFSSYSTIAGPASIPSTRLSLFMLPPSRYERRTPSSPHCHE
jgi:hypothetical protein